MPLDFPNAPTSNQQFTALGITWVWDGTKWTSIGTSFPGGATSYLPLAGGVMSGQIVMPDGSNALSQNVGDARYLNIAGGDTMTGSLTVTATGGSVARAIQDVEADRVNVLDYGAVRNTGVDSTPAFNAAIASGGYGSREIYVPGGTYRLNGQVNLGPNQVLRGAADHSTVIFVDQSFSPTANGVISLTGVEGGGPIVRDLYFIMAQPPATVTTLTAAASSGATTITVASTANISVNFYVSDTNGSGTNVAFPTKVTAIAGNVITLSAPLTGNIANGANMYFAFSRSNMLTLTNGGTSGVGGSGIMYPPVIYALNTATSRWRLSNLHIEGAWDGIYCPGGVFWMEHIEMGALHIGLNTDGQPGLDFSHIEGWHAWCWGGNSPVGFYFTYHEYGNVIAMQLGRSDGLNMTDICLMDSQLIFTTNNVTSTTITNLMMDGNGEATIFNGSGIIKITNVYWSCSTPVPIQCIGTGYVSISNWYMQWGGTNPGISVSAGLLQMTGGHLGMANGATTVVNQTGGQLIFNNNYISTPSTLTAPTIAQTGGAIVAMNNVAHSLTSGTLISVGADGASNVITNNIFPGGSITIPSVPLAGTYQLGTYGSGTPWGQQLFLGAQNQGGRVDFRRGSDGAANAWIGMNYAAGSDLVLTNLSGSGNITHNCQAAGANIFQYGGTEIARMASAGITLSGSIIGTTGSQLIVGATSNAGRIDFRRSTDGAAGSFVGFAAAGTSNLLDLTCPGGSSMVRLNGTLADVFLISGTEVGRFSTQGIGAAKTTAAATAPGAGFATLAFVAGTTAGTGKLVAYCGTSTTPVTIVDNIGAGF